MKKNVVILGSSGSIGRNTLDVVRRFGDRLRVIGLSVNTRTDVLASQARVFRPCRVAVSDEKKALDFRSRDRGRCKVLIGREGLCELAALRDADIVVIAIVGFEAVFPLLSAIRAKKTIALANKESIVVGGPLVMRQVRRCGATIIPIDSEQSAIFQCLEGHERSSINRIYLTASGGPLVDLPKGKISRVARKTVLAHPRWKMGEKITVDSATLMNKGLEVIETQQLFEVPLDKIGVLVHRQAVVHSMVEFKDSSVLAQLGVADMRLPIQYALSYPDRWEARHLRLDPLRMADLTFRAPDTDRFPCLALAYEAGRLGGSVPCVLNAANETAVGAFLRGRLGFGRIPRVIEETLYSKGYERRAAKIEDLLCADRFARQRAAERIRHYEKKDKR